MSGTNGLGPEYRTALAAYLSQRDEATLATAYEIGRRAMGEGRGVLDLAAVHRDALIALVQSWDMGDRERFTADAAGFFQEVLSPFEMSLRGYREANHALQLLGESLREQKEAVEAANRELESFSYSVSHDLRAPLRSIDGFSQALLADYGDELDEQGKKYLLHVVGAAQRMAQLIDDLIGLAQVTRTDFSRTRVDLSALGRRVIDRLRASEPHRDVLCRIHDDMIAACDGRLLSVALESLLGNAWKFSSKRERAEIEFGLTNAGGATAYFVRDNGAGFDMAYSHKLFGTFQRLHSPGDFEGTGIGLAAVQRVIHRHRGCVWAEGKVDGGATFYFTLGEDPAAP